MSTLADLSVLENLQTAQNIRHGLSAPMSTFNIPIYSDRKWYIGKRTSKPYSKAQYTPFGQLSASDAEKEKKRGWDIFESFDTISDYNAACEKYRKTGNFTSEQN